MRRAGPNWLSLQLTWGNEDMLSARQVCRYCLSHIVSSLECKTNFADREMATILMVKCTRFNIPH